MESAAAMQEVPKVAVKRPCCQCVQTKKIRDLCIKNNGEEQCQDFIAAFKDCVRVKKEQMKS